jgi:hypothetical protein
LVKVLLPHPHHQHADVVVGITATLLVGAVSPTSAYRRREAARNSRTGWRMSAISAS